MLKYRKCYWKQNTHRTPRSANSDQHRKILTHFRQRVVMANNSKLGESYFTERFSIFRENDILLKKVQNENVSRTPANLNFLSWKTRTTRLRGDPLRRRMKLVILRLVDFELIGNIMYSIELIGGSDSELIQFSFGVDNVKYKTMPLWKIQSKIPGKFDDTLKKLRQFFLYKNKSFQIIIHRGHFWRGGGCIHIWQIFEWI